MVFLEKTMVLGTVVKRRCESEKQLERLHEIFQEINEDAHFTGVIHEMHTGFLDKKLRLALYTDHEIFERFHRYKNRSQTSRSQALTLKELRDLHPGDYVTHIHHGIGQFAGDHQQLPPNPSSTARTARGRRTGSRACRRHGIKRRENQESLL